MITEMGRDLQKIDDDILFAKRVIKEKLCKDADIIKYLHNDELERVGADPDDYYGVNILPFITPPSQAHWLQQSDIPSIRLSFAVTVLFHPL